MWAVQRSRHMTLETIAPMGDDAVVSLPSGILIKQGGTEKRSDDRGQLHHPVELHPR